MDLGSLLLTTVIVFYGTAYVSFSAKHTGLFAYIAEKTLLGNWSGVKISLVIFLVSGALCFLTDNDIVILTLTPILLHVHGRYDIRNLLLIQFAAANTFSIFSLISNPTNVIIATRFNVDYLKFIEIMWPIGVIAASIVFLLGPKYKNSIKLIVRRKTKVNIQLATSGFAVIVLLLLLMTSRLTGIDIPIAVLIVVTFLIIRDISTKTLGVILANIPIRPGVVIFLGFMLAVAMDKFGVSNQIALAISHLQFTEAAFIVLTSSVLLAAIIVNIPMAIVMSNILALTSFEAPQKIALVSLVFLSSDVATLVFRRASLAGYMWQHMIEKDDGADITKWYFAKTLAPAGILALIACLIFVVSTA